MEINGIQAKSSIFILILILSSISAKAIERSTLFPFKKDSSLFEINKVIFVGNNSFTSEELFSFISSKATNKNFVHEILDYYYVEGKENKITPKTILINLESSLEGFQSEYKFLNTEKLRLDSISISNFYNKNGFHFSKIGYEVYADSANKENVVKFNIEENERFLLDSLILFGLEDLDSLTSIRVDRYIKKNKSKYFVEDGVIYIINGIQNILQNSGYFFSKKLNEKVIVKKDIQKDNVEVEFYLGDRYRFGKVNFVDIKEDQHKVTDNQKRSLLDWKEGDYYSKAKIERSIRNLLSLGTFNSITIDTTNFRDSIIDYAVITNYRNQQEAFFEPGVNQTQNLFYNVFLRGSYSHRNVFGEAQIFNAGVSILNRDFEDYIKTKNQGFVNHVDDFVDEISANLFFSDPYIWKVNDAYLGINFAPLYSYRRIDNFFELSTFLLPFTIPIKLKTDLDLTNASLFLNLERQQPVRFDEFIESGFENENFDRVFQSLVLYSDLNNYFKTSNSLFSSIAIGGRVIRDKRNNPFIPTRGHLFNLDLEAAFGNVFGVDLGLTHYLRLLTSWTTYTSISKNEVVGTKLKFGGFGFFDESNRFASLDKQFFAGGANSVRGWDSRKLRYTNEKVNELELSSRRLLENFVGNMMVIEGSMEYRLKFKEPEINLGAINEHISSMGVTVFFDFGNSFGWLLESPDFNFGDIFTKLAYSVGSGITYETPVGPLRLDLALPIYGPINYTYEGIWVSEDVLSNVNWHIGLGYAF